MNNINEQRLAYLPPEMEALMEICEELIANSDWNTAGIEDEFVEMYDL